VRAGAALLGLLLLAGAAGAQAAPSSAAACVPPDPSAATPATEAGAALEQGNALAAKGDIDAALAAYADSAARAEAGGEPAVALLARANAVRARIDAGRTEGAGDDIDALLASAAQQGDPRARARLRIHLARSLADLGNALRAAEVFTLAATDAADVDRRLESFAIGYRAELYEKAGRRDEALALARRALFAAQRGEAPDALVRWQWLVARLLAAAGDADGAIASYRAAVDTLRAAHALGGAELEPLYLGFVDLLLAHAGDSASQELLLEARAALEDLKAGELRDYFRDPCLDALRTASPDTVPGALVVYPIALADRLVLIAGREGRLSQHVVAVDRERFVAQVRELRRLLEKRTTRQYLRPAAALYEWLIRPLDLTGVDTLVFVPGGALRTVPLSALYDEKTSQFLIEKVPVAITPSLTLTEPRPIDRASVRLLAAGLSESVQGYPALVNVRPEIEAVSAVFPAERLLDADFQAARFEREVGERVFDIVHVASHGEFLADVSQSYLLTWDGRLSMDRLADLVGTTRFRERGLELLTLSACQTATGDDRAALGLAGVALRAGARSALATLWSVNDEVSAKLVAEFYAGLSDPSLSRAQALQKAQVGVLHTYAYRHPSYWAPYLLISSWL
jgi:CHAT domain-containing protein